MPDSMTQLPRVPSDHRSQVYSFGETAVGTRLRLPDDRRPRPIESFSQGVIAILEHATDKRVDWSQADVQAFLSGPAADVDRCVLTGAQINKWLQSRYPGS